jgi:hypothetical protein
MTSRMGRRPKTLSIGPWISWRNKGRKGGDSVSRGRVVDDDGGGVVRWRGSTRGPVPRKGVASNRCRSDGPAHRKRGDNNRCSSGGRAHRKGRDNNCCSSGGPAHRKRGDNNRCSSDGPAHRKRGDNNRCSSGGRAHRKGADNNRCSSGWSRRSVPCFEYSPRLVAVHPLVARRANRNEVVGRDGTILGGRRAGTRAIRTTGRPRARGDWETRSLDDGAVRVGPMFEGSTIRGCAGGVRSARKPSTERGLREPGDGR